ncbi:MAG: hypothetical protein JXM79_19290 [Sedimentisphaerales bacterium]|nr:hypothetical protein [Sedimentisphaerales bacterium]
MCHPPNKRLSLLLISILVFLSSSLYAQDPTLVLYFSFDDEAMDEATDHSQYRNNGTIEGKPEVVAGQFASALMFDATDDQIVVPTNETLDIENEITLMLWAKPGPNLTADWRNLVGKSPTNVLGNATFSYSIRTDNSGALRFSLNLGGWQYVLGPTVEEDTWYHITGTYDGTQLIFYVDGESAGTTQASGTITVTTDPVCIGNLINAAGASQNEFWTGVLDEVRIWNRALGTDEVLRNMEQGRADLAKPMPYAWHPDPADGADHESSWVTLRWSSGDLTVSHDVYLGDNFDDVNDATRDSDVFRSNQTTNFYVAGFPGFAFPDGLVPGTTYYWRIDEVNDDDPNSPWKGSIWSFWVLPKKAYEPNPADGTEFVDTELTLTWTPGMNAVLHTVYISDNFDEVNNATVGSSQTDTTFTPDTLEFETTYYWRVDEFDGVTMHKGDIWSFTTKPFIAISDPNLVCWWTLNEGIGTSVIDWSGHGHDGTVQGNAEWVLGYDSTALHFREGGSGYVVHSLGGASDWASGTLALWVKADTVGQAQYSSAFSSHYPNTAGFQLDVDGANPGQYRINPSGLLFGPVTTAWVHLVMTFEGTAATLYYNGEKAVSGTLNDTTFNQFAININRNATNWLAGTIDDFRAYDKVLTQDEIKLTMRIDPLLAWNPNPGNGATPDIDTALPLSWSAGDSASQHDVFFGTNEDTVDDADTSDTTGVYRGRQSSTSYTPSEGIEWGGGPYYWRVDEVYSDGTITKGRIWRFTVVEFILVDDFESYTDDDTNGEAIWQHWIDGYGVSGNGAQVGYLFPPYAEQTIVNSGNQSMPLIYDNTTGATNSEAVLTLTSPRDWTRHGLANVSLWFRGYPGSVGSFTEGPAGTYTMTGSGSDIGGTADQCHFAYKTLTGAGTIIAKINSVQNTHAWAKAGVMIRETLDAGSKHAFACVSAGNGVAFQGRSGTDATSFSTNQTDVTAPHWVKLERDAAANFAVSHSADGTNWQSVGNTIPVNIPMTSTVYIGFALTSRDATQTCEAVFSNVTTTGSVSGQWKNQDIGISSNAAEPMYIALSNANGASAIVAHDDPAAATIDTWTEWAIPLQSFADQGVNLSDVDTMAIGLGTKAGTATPNGSGTMYFDDIRLYPPASETNP